MNKNLVHTILLVLSTLLGAFLQFDWTAVGVDASTAGHIAGALVMASSVIKMLLNGTGNGATGLVKKD